MLNKVPSPKKSSRVQRHRHGDSSSVRQEEDPASEVCRRAASYESLAPGCATRSHRAPSQTRLASLSARTALNCPPRSVGGERRAPVQCGPAGERGARRECLWSTRMLRAAARAMLAATVVLVVCCWPGQLVRAVTNTGRCLGHMLTCEEHWQVVCQGVDDGVQARSAQSARGHSHLESAQRRRR